MNVRNLASLLVALLVTLCASGAFAQARARVIEELAPPPRLLLRHQEALGITKAQKKELKEILKDAQSKALDLEFKVEEEASKLAKLMESPNLDVNKALEQADRLMAAESALKRVKLEMLLRTKKILTAEQLKKVQEVREARKESRKDRLQKRIEERRGK